MPRQCLVHRIATDHPADTAGLAALIDAGTLPAAAIVAILGKTEGNGCVNDFTRPYAVAALEAFLAARGGRPDVAMVMSGGTEGGLSPHLLVFAVTEAPAPAPSGAARLAIGTARTREFRPDEIGRQPQIDATRDAVRAAMAAAGIAGAEDVHYVQVKCPLLTQARAAGAGGHGGTVTTDTYGSMAFSRGASALGVAVALGELGAATAAQVCRDRAAWSARASTSAGVELMHNEVVVLGNSPAWGGSLAIAHGVMRDAIDLDAVAGVLAALGLPVVGQLPAAARARLRAVLAKAEPASDGRIRGRRHIMGDDSDINATRHARALVGGVLAGLTGMTDLFVSGGAEHQGPDGGGPVAMIAEVAPPPGT